MRSTQIAIEDLIQETPDLDSVSFNWGRLSEMMRGGLSPTEVIALLDTDSGLRRWMQDPLPAYGLDEGALWRHSLTAAVAVDLARIHSRVPIAPEAFAAALLHDVGKRVLSSHLQAPKEPHLCRVEHTRGADLDRAEMEILRHGHAEIGAHLIQRWNLSEATAEGIRFHHAPILAPSAQAKRVAAQVALGDAVAMAIGAGHGGLIPDKPFDPGLAGMLSISREGFEGLCVAVESQLEDNATGMAA